MTVPPSGVRCIVQQVDGLEGGSVSVSTTWLAASRSVPGPVTSIVRS